MRSKTEQELLRLIRAGDRKAFEYFYNQYYDRLVTLVLFLTKSEIIAEDIAQEAFMKLWEKHETLNPDQSLKGFVRQITRNLVYDHSRKVKVAQHYQVKLAAPKLADQIIEEINYKDLNNMLSKALDQLSPEKQTIFKQSRFEDKTYAEIAREMETTPKAVERHMAKTLNFIRQYFLKYSREALSLLIFSFLELF